jgi:hypothetical protein
VPSCAGLRRIRVPVYVAFVCRSTSHSCAGLRRIACRHRLQARWSMSRLTYMPRRTYMSRLTYMSRRTFLAQLTYMPRHTYMSQLTYMSRLANVRHAGQIGLATTILVNKVCRHTHMHTHTHTHTHKHTHRTRSHTQNPTSRRALPARIFPGVLSLSVLQRSMNAERSMNTRGLLRTPPSRWAGTCGFLY